jgi:hypothetical protein
MKILTTTSGSIKFIPRENASPVTLTLTNKNTRTSETVSVGVAYSNGYMTVYSGIPTLVENTNYSMEVKNSSGDVIYRDTIFCTNQTDFDKFDVHKDDYVTEDTFDNEFIVL